MNPAVYHLCVDNAAVAALLIRIADLLEIGGENPFKIRAYREAARQIADLLVPVRQLQQDDKLREVPGIGGAIAAKVAEVLDTGRLEFLEQLERAVPPALLTLRQVPGLGPRTAKEIYDALGITTVDALEDAARGERLRTVPGIKAKTEENILKGIEIWRRRYGRILLARALPLSAALVQRLRGLPEVLQAECAGSVRRRTETIGDLDLLVAVTAAGPVVDAFVGASEVTQVLAGGPTKASVRTADGLQVDLRVVEAGAFGAALQYFTGSQAHNVQLRGLAERRGLKINEYGVFTAAGERIGGATEAEIYAAVGLPWIPPELREGRGELEAAQQGALPELARLEDLKGDLHVSLAAPSEEGLTALARAARARGYHYLVLTAPPESGLIPLTRRAAVQAPGIRLLAGAEVDLLPDGTPAIDAAQLRPYDWVVGCAPEDARSPDDASRCLLGAIASGAVDILARPLGRRLGLPPRPAPDMAAVLAAAAPARVALEIDGRPNRLDLDDVWARRARDAGVALALGSVAADAEGLGALESALWVARRGWCAAGDLLNALPEQAWRQWRDQRRSLAAPASLQ